jgi:phosphoglucosamine mutase
MHKYPQYMINVPIGGKFSLKNCPAIQEAVLLAESELKDCGRILLRPSGTEPVVRVMVEAEDAELANRVALRVAGVVEAEAGVDFSR